MGEGQDQRHPGDRQAHALDKGLRRHPPSMGRRADRSLDHEVPAPCAGLRATRSSRRNPHHHRSIRNPPQVMGMTLLKHVLSTGREKPRRSRTESSLIEHRGRHSSGTGPQPIEGVCEIGQGHLCLSPRKSDRADEQPAPALLLREDMLDRAAHRRLARVRQRRRGRHRFARRRRLR
jgi:hypothetical protein